MIRIPESCITGRNEPGDMNWQDIYVMLQPLANYIAYQYCTPAWRGQESDIAEEIMQETVRKLFEYEQKVKRGESAPIHALLPMVRVIAHNYGKDMLRRDKRLVRIEAEDEMEQFYFRHEEGNIEEDATENAYHEVLFTEIACEIAHFPTKQRQALLIDMATHMSFEPQPTPLQKAFLKVGIELQTYQNTVPTTPEEHNRHTSLLAHAYKRVSNLTCVQKYTENDINSALIAEGK